MILLRGPEYAVSKQKRISDILLAKAISPARLATRAVLLYEFHRYGINDPLVFEQARVGQNGEIFMMEKFRTLQPPKDKVPISRLTDFMRRTGLDETQQINLIQRGVMSFVGHRPLIPSEHDEVYERANPSLVDRHRKIVLPTRPGEISTWGLASHIGLQHEANSYDMRLELDIKDVIDGSLVYDIELCAKALYMATNNKLLHGNIHLGQATR